MGQPAACYRITAHIHRWPVPVRWRQGEAGYRRPLAAGSDTAARAGPKRLRTDTASGLAVTLRRGPHGHYIQLGGAGEAKPRRMSVPGGMDPDGIGLEAALKLLALPREVGEVQSHR